MAISLGILTQHFQTNPDGDPDRGTDSSNPAEVPKHGAGGTPVAPPTPVALYPAW